MNGCLGTFGGLEPQSNRGIFFSAHPLMNGWMKAPRVFIVPGTRGNSMLCYDRYRTLCET